MGTKISAEHINTFLQASGTVLNQLCGYQVAFGSVSMENLVLTADDLLIMLGITGELTGQVCICIKTETAKQIVSKMMMGMPVTEMDDMARSAISELGNMIMGSAATLLSEKNTLIDITPPTLGIGKVTFLMPDVVSLKVPVTYDTGGFDMYFLLKTNL